MARIFLGLALLAICLVLGNAILAFALGDFGASSQRYSSERRMFEELRASAGASTAEIDASETRREQAAVLLRDQRNRFWPHIWLGIVASLVSLLVNSISITYFIGTNRWCREVADAYSMVSDVVQRSQQLKRQSFLWSLAGILLTLAIAGLGAAADPFASTAEPAAWVQWHWMLGLGGGAMITASFYRQYKLLGANHVVIQDVLSEAEQIRADRATLVAGGS